MSFSKARIQRFNELTSAAPPPGAYDPKFDRKVKGTVIEKKGRFNDGKSTTSNHSGPECNASVSSRGTSNSSVKQFRTPQIPKKRKDAKTTGMSCPRAKTKLYEFKEPQAPYEPLHELADLKVELANKDKTIHENEKYIEDMKAELTALTDKYEALQKRHSQIEEQHQKDIESMAKLQQEVMENQNEKYQAEIQALQSELTSILKDKENEIIDRDIIIDEMKSKINNLERLVITSTEQEEIVNKMMNLEVVTQRLDTMTEDLNKALNFKDSQMSDLLQLQLETKQRLVDVQTELKESEKQVADLEINLESFMNESNSQSLILNQGIIEEMTMILQEYFDYENYDGKWNIDNRSFPPEIEDFLKKIRKFVTDLKLTYEREIELSRDNFNEERENLEQELETKKLTIKDLENKLTELNETNSFLTEELQDVQKLYKDISRTLHETKNELEAANEKYNKALTAHKAELELTRKLYTEEQTRLKDLLEEARNEYLQELDNMTTARNKELAEVKLAMEKRIEDEKKRMQETSNKMVENAEAVTRETLKACREESDERVRRVIAETDAKVTVLVREAKNAAEEELRQASEKYTDCIDHLENEKSNLSAKLAQRDLEVIQLTGALEEMKCTAETQESFSQSLQAELDRAEAELVEKKDELRNLKDQIRTESAEMVARRRRLDVVMAENQASIAALTHRLAQSEAEVERLQHELEEKEASLSGCRETIENITHNSKMVREQVDSITDKIDEKVEHINQLEAKNVSDIKAVKSALYAKIENLTAFSLDELTKAQKECKETSEQNVELRKNLRQMSDKLNEAMMMLLKLEEVNDQQAIEVCKLELNISKLQQQVNNKDKFIEENKFTYEKQLQQYKTELTEMNEKLARFKNEAQILESKKNEVEEKKYDFEELKFKYNDELSTLKHHLESEKNQRKQLEQEVEEYKQKCETLTSVCNQIKIKHAEVIGQSNHKQRTKHITELKEKINLQQLDLLRLRQELDTKSNVIDELRLANEKLKFDERRQFGLGKENIHAVSSPHKSLFPKSANTTPVSSPHKPHTPLRDRND